MSKIEWVGMINPKSSVKKFVLIYFFPSYWLIDHSFTEANHYD